MRRRRIVALAALAAVIGMAACSDGRESGGSADASAPMSSLARARAAGTIRVGYANEAPYAYLDSASGKLTGEAPEIARVVLKDLGIGTVEGVLTEFGSLIPGLKAKRFDIIAAGMYILPKRCEQIAFSNPTYAIGEAFIVKKGNPLALHGYADAAKHPEARIGVVAGAVERSYAQAMGVPDERIVLFPTPAAALAGVEAGRVDAYAATSLTANDLLRKAGPGTVELAQPFRDPVIDGKAARGFGAFGFRQEDTELKAAFDAALAKYIGSREHLELIRPFGFTARELPGQVTAAELCQG